MYCRAVASGGGGGEGQKTLDLLNQTKSVSVYGFFFFRLSYFDCSDLQLFAIFMAEKLVGPQCVQIVSKIKQNPLLKLACIRSICKVHSNLQRVPVVAQSGTSLVARGSAITR